MPFLSHVQLVPLPLQRREKGPVALEQLWFTTYSQCMFLDLYLEGGLYLELYALAPHNKTVLGFNHNMVLLPFKFPSSELASVQ